MPAKKKKKEQCSLRQSYKYLVIIARSVLHDSILKEVSFVQKCKQTLYKMQAGASLNTTQAVLHTKHTYLQYSEDFVIRSNR